ncbi:MAG: beta-glucosidase [Verrucomicrobia bacterium]|nr:beta-glucosidase [Verrucomicrobiota bacterium]MCH8511259.1 beta-glucosidase [Kiritimatiellia bacterium]
MSFPKSFTWGAAAASYQIEGAAKQGGRGPDVWDMLCREPGRIEDGHNGDVGTDHYNRLEGDLDLFQQIGLQAYRFSISWTRILPEGVGRVNEIGLDFYDRLVDGMLARNITPWATLFHWDYPLALYCRGGWLNRNSIDWFAEYTQVVTERLGDRVQNWMTQNEPQCFVGLGHGGGGHAPGLKYHWPELLRTAHHALVAHGESVKIIRANCPQSHIGAAPVACVSLPETESAEDIRAAYEATFSVTDKTLWKTHLFADPMVLGHYPDDALKVFAEDLEGTILDGDMERIHQPLDFFGFNIYNGQRVKAGPDGKAVSVTATPGHPATTMHWRVEPTCMYWATKWFHERYKLPVVITENGLANNDWVHLDGKVHDPQRIDFTHRYLLELHRAIEDGAQVDAYFHWSVMDNFEWALGYNRRFGLIHVDYGTLVRTLKESAHWYRGVIESNGEALLGRV